MHFAQKWLFGDVFSALKSIVSGCRTLMHSKRRLAQLTNVNEMAECVTFE